LTLDIGEGEFLWYRHLEDNSGGISGIIIKQLLSGDQVPGDFNEDGVIDVADFTILAGHFNQAGRFADGDMNFSGHIDLEDFVRFRTAFEDSQGPAAAVPEPTSTVLALLMSFGIVPFIRRRRSPRNSS